MDSPFDNWKTLALCCCLLCLPIPEPAEAAPPDPHFFPSSLAPVSDFARRRAAEDGIPIPTQQPGALIRAELTLPDGNGPHPAVLLFADCMGWAKIDSDWPQRLNRWGYASMKIFSFASRPERDDPCNHGRIRTVGNSEMVFDAVGAIRYLAGIDSVDANRVAVMGWGLGATGALKAVNGQGFARLFSERARAAVAFYPACELHSEFIAPSLVLVGGRDEKHPLLHCREMKRLAAAGSPPFELELFDELDHGFDLLTPLPADSHDRLRQLVKNFLQRYLQ